MCGIAGAMGQTLDRRWINREVDALIHRGPDHQSVISISSTLAFGSARLAMTDPNPRSNQPFSINFGRQWLIFNGEIYNFRDLRKKMIEKGIQFTTQSDTETLAHWLSLYGALGVNEIEGMFAFAFFDIATGILMLGRDSLGKKPLYWTINEGNVYWSSSSRRLPNNGIRNKISLVSYLTLGYFVDPNTEWEKINSVRPGSVLEISEKLEIREWELNRLPLLKGFEETFDFSLQTIRERLLKAVEKRIEGHSEIALSLSGGVDSTIIAILLKELGANPTCFSATWSDSDKQRYNKDSEHARNISKTLGFRYVETEMLSSREVPTFLNEFLENFEEPNNNPTGLSMLTLYRRIAQQGFRLILTGDGSDEIFAGYPRHVKSSSKNRDYDIKAKIVHRILLEKNTEDRTKLHGLLQRILPSSNIESWLYWHQVFSPNEVLLIGREFGISRRDIDCFRNGLATLAHLDEKQSNLRNLMDRDHQIWLVNESNRKLDRISMAYSIEARSPFQDEGVIEAAIAHSRVNIKSQVNKNLLWETFPELHFLGVRRDKAGFTSPVGHWLRQNNELVENSLRSLIQQINLDKEFADLLRNAPARGSYHGIMKLWSLIVLAQWNLHR